MHAVFLVFYVVLPLLALWRSRSIAWTVIALLASVSVAGVIVNFVIDHIGPVNWLTLQLFTLAALLVPAILSFTRAPLALSPRRRQLFGVVLPVGVLTAFFMVMTTWWTQVPAFYTPVSFLMGHAVAEDNAKWLDFAAHLATGGAIEQSVPLGGPLQLFLTAIATLMAVVSMIFFDGVNQVMVAGNTAIYAQFALVALAPLALAPLAEVAYKVRGRGGAVRVARIPAPVIWSGSLILAVAVLIATAYGHLTWQYSAIAVTLWITTFLVDVPIPRARLLTSLAVVASMTVWLPLNVIALVVLIGCFGVLVVSGLRGSRWDWVGLGLTVIVAVGVAQPLLSSFSFVSASSSSALGTMAGGAGLVSAGVVLAVSRPLAFVDSTLFAAGGGTEKVGPLLLLLAVVGALGAAVWSERQVRGNATYVRLLPVALIAGFAVVLQVLDQWVTGSAPNYGSNKFAFLAAVAIAAGSLPLAIILVSPHASGMTVARWTAVGAVVLVLVVDSLLVRAIAAARPEQWSPPIPFNNPRSYWWPADVNGAASQQISGNPVGCVYLPQGAKAPSGILDSQLSDPQRVYSCTRLLAGLAGEDTGAQPMVDWLRREWLTNQRAWEGVYGYLAAMPDSVLDRPVILLDDGSNVIGLESMRSLLSRYPADSLSR